MFKKKEKTPIEQTEEYKAQKKVLDTPAVIEHADVGEGQSNDQAPGILLEQAVIGMTDTEYRTQVIALLMELKDDIGQLRKDLQN